MSAWIRTRHDWLDDYKPREVKKSPTPIIERLKCEICGSTRIPVQRTKTMENGTKVRYHKCRDCNHRFKTTEEDRGRNKAWNSEA